MLGDVAHRTGCRSRSIRCSVLLTSAAAISIVLALAGCGSSAPGTTVVGGTTTVVAHGQAGPGPLVGYSVTVSVAGGALSPPEVTVPAGSGVTFINAEDDNNTKHELVADNGSFDTPGPRPGRRVLRLLRGPGHCHVPRRAESRYQGPSSGDGRDDFPATGAFPTGPWIGVGKNGLTAAQTQTRVGDPVTFYNSEDDNTVNHHIVADDGSFDTGVLKPGQSYVVTFESPGTYSFHDALDSSIKGTITAK